MADRFQDPDRAEAQLWTQLGRTRAGMLWIEGAGQHPQPMTHFTDDDEGRLWFITASDTDLVGALGHGATARFTVVSDKRDYHASLVGALQVSEDDDKLAELWSLPVAAWFEKGLEDPKVTLLRFVPREAAVWSSEASVLVGIKMIRAAMSEGISHPDVGEHHVLELNTAA